MKGKNTLILSPVAMIEIVEYALNKAVFTDAEAVTVEAIRMDASADPLKFEIDFVEQEDFEDSNG